MILASVRGCAHRDLHYHMPGLAAMSGPTERHNPLCCIVIASTPPRSEYGHMQS
jgi:hypothetical protein